MDIDIEIGSRQWRALPRVKALARKAATAALAGSGVSFSTQAGLCLMLTDDATIRQANRIWRAQDKPTNVLSFQALSSGQLDQARYLGDVLLAYETIAAEALAEGKPMADHVAHLVVHGVLHLLGHDHDNERQAQAMEARERAILAELGIADPYRDDA